MAKIRKTANTNCRCETTGVCAVPDIVYNGTTTRKTVWEFLIKLHKHPRPSSAILPSIYPKEMKTCTKKNINRNVKVALFIRAKNRKKPQSPSQGNRIKKLW